MSKKWYLILFMASSSIDCMHYDHREESPDRPGSKDTYSTAPQNSNLLQPAPANKDAHSNPGVTLSKYPLPEKPYIEINMLDPRTQKPEKFYSSKLVSFLSNIHTVKKELTFLWPSDLFALVLYKKTIQANYYVLCIISSYLKKDENDGYKIKDPSNPYQEEINLFLNDEKITIYQSILVGKNPNLDIEACKKTQLKDSRFGFQCRNSLSPTFKLIMQPDQWK